MTDLSVTPEPPARMPLLAEDELKALPTPRPVFIPVLGGLALLVLGWAVVFLLLPHPTGPSSPADDARQVALNLAPWVLVFPVLRRLDVRRVPWFFLSLFSPLLGPMLLAFVGFRALSLPYRTWPVGYWHAHRAQRIESTATWVLVDEDRAVEPELPPMLVRWEQVERVAWVFFMVSALVFRIRTDLLDSTWGGLWFSGLLALAVGPIVVDWVLRRRESRAGSR